MTAKLHCFGESGNSYKAALAMELTGFLWQPVYVDFFGGETRTPEFRKINPMGEAPVLVHEGQTISQSGVILKYVAERTGKLGALTSAQELEISRWILWDNYKLSSLCGVTRFLANFIPSEKRPMEVIRWHKSRLQVSFGVLNTFLSDRKWLVGGRPTIADLSCCGYLYYREPFGFEPGAWPHISAWLERLSELDGWRHPYDLMPGSPADRR
ncbi:MAG: glutathione S-transferase [Rhodobacteraceae bacterium]|nr:glutathione S-transferase [Paracoccaceae bacterium]